MGRESLAERVLRVKRFEFGREFRVATERQVGLDPILERRKPQLLQPPNWALRPSVVGELGKRRPPPQRQCVGEQWRRASWLNRGKRLAPASCELLEAPEIHPLGRNGQ